MVDRDIDIFGAIRPPDSYLHRVVSIETLFFDFDAISSRADVGEFSSTF
jgi:hypothetical protein